MKTCHKGVNAVPFVLHTDWYRMHHQTDERLGRLFDAAMAMRQAQLSLAPTAAVPIAAGASGASSAAGGGAAGAPVFPLHDAGQTEALA
eukprot:4965459-Amphidinium_carterae.1